MENRNKSPFAETSQVTSPIHDKHALMGMKIESVEADGQSARVNTTGAAFVFDLPNDAIICSQKIPRRRKVATIHGLSLKCLKPVSKTPDRCVFGETAEQETLVVSADSLLTISLAPGATVDITGSYRPAWEGQESNCLFLPDETGGVGLYLIGNGSGTKPVSKDTEWTVNYQTASSSKLLVSVFPPRPFDIQQSGETLLHSFSWRRPYPSDQELAAWRPIGSVLALHSWIWQGSQGSTYGIEQDDSWATMAFVPKDAQELQRVVEAAHRLGMKVIPYMSPYYFGNPGGQVVKSTLGRFLNTVQDVLSQYGFDGVYYDGLYAGDIDGSYYLSRRTRQMIGDGKILVLHSTNMPLSNLPCPFIDTYATYLLRGENRPWDDQYVRWNVTSYNLGNSIGLLSYETCRLSPEVIDRLLSLNARLPYWVQDGTWYHLKYYPSADELNLINAEYFPKLKNLLRDPGRR